MDAARTENDAETPDYQGLVEAMAQIERRVSALEADRDIELKAMRAVRRMGAVFTTLGESLDC